MVMFSGFGVDTLLVTASDSSLSIIRLYQQLLDDHDKIHLDLCDDVSEFHRS
jgi:hypothetical protein